MTMDSRNRFPVSGHLARAVFISCLLLTSSLSVQAQETPVADATEAAPAINMQPDTSATSAPSPSMDTLSAPQAAPAPVAASAPKTLPAPTASGTPLQQYLDEEKAQENSSDALPVTATMKVRAEGFELAGEKGVSVSQQYNMENMTREELAESIRQEAFDAALTGLFPLRPEEIEELLRHYNATEKAAQSPVTAQPKPEVSVQTISMDPGVNPPVIKTSAGFVTTVNILDITGAPWPIQDITWAGDFEVIEPEEGGHIIRITPLTKFAFGNMSVRLLTLKTPITFALKADFDVVHYRVDARVPEFGPFAQAQLLEGGSQLVAGDSMLTSILDGVPPSGSVRLDVSGVDGRTSAYKLGAKTYVRTPLTLLSPGWESAVSSADGMNVYALNETPVLLLSDQGKFMRAKLKEREDLLDE